MICKNCGNEIPDVAHFCPKCGYDVKNTSKSSDSDQLKMLVCPHCGNLIRDKTEFCYKCGMPVDNKKQSTGKTKTHNPFKRNSYMSEAKKWIITGIVAVAAVFTVIVGTVYTHQIRTENKEVAKVTDENLSETGAKEDSAEAKEDFAATVLTIGDTVSNSHASFTLLDFQWTTAISLDEYNNFKPVSEDYSGDCYRAKDGYVLACIEGTYQYTGTKIMSYAYRPYDNSGKVWSVHSLSDLIDINWNGEYNFTGSDYCVASSKVGSNVTNTNYLPKNDRLLEQDPLGEPVTFRCYFSVPSRVAEDEDAPLTLTFYLPGDNEAAEFQSDQRWTPYTEAYTFVINPLDEDDLTV